MSTESVESPAEGLFGAALAIPDPTARAAFLDRACGADLDLRARVERLLAAHAAAGRFLEAPDRPADGDTACASGPDGTGSFTVGGPTEVVAGRYKLLQQIGEGGMGTVWMADQMEPVRRRVAIKLVRADRGASAAILARFEAERQAIALMDHPHIARLLDAGSTEDGRPFFVMELVKGVPITEYCDKHRLTVPDRLRLFARVCAAVQHAHQKGVIHRDLKPSNVLVVDQDGAAVPKVIDFGLAKAVGGLPLTDQPLLTGFGSVLGTPLYMAPEQAGFDPADVDTRADVYALGVILYELLTGTTPLTRDALRQVGTGELLRLVREHETPTPSSRLVGGEAAAVAANRHTEPTTLVRFIRGELDWVVLKALAKERDRRYESAAGFARDVERFLAHEPVSAGPPTAGYRLRKFVRRNRPQVAATVLVLAVLVAGVIGTTVGLVRAEWAWAAEQQAKLDAEDKRLHAENEQRRAEAGEKLAGERLLQVEAEKKQVEEERQVAQAGRDFLKTKLLRPAGPREQADLLQAVGAPGSVDPNLTLRTLLDRGATELAPDRIEAAFPGRPRVQAELLDTIGHTYAGIGRYETAIELLTRAAELHRAVSGPDHRETLITLHNLAIAYYGAGQLRTAINLLERVRTGSVKALGSESDLALSDSVNLACLYGKAARWPEAIELLEQVRAVRSKNPGTKYPIPLFGLTTLSGAYAENGQVRDALKLAQQILTGQTAEHGPEHPDTLFALDNLTWA